MKHVLAILASRRPDGLHHPASLRSWSGPDGSRRRQATPATPRSMLACDRQAAITDPGVPAASRQVRHIRPDSIVMMDFLGHPAKHQYGRQGHHRWPELRPGLARGRATRPGRRTPPLLFAHFPRINPAFHRTGRANGMPPGTYFRRRAVES